jgi:hypothetical protein
MLIGLSTRVKRNEVIADITLNRLPRELRDEVYKHLWNTYTYQPSPCAEEFPNFVDRFPSTYGFLREESALLILSHTGETFIEEAVQCFFENGCAGRYTEVEDLPRFLATPFPGVNITPQSNILRSLNVKIYTKRFKQYRNPVTIKPEAYIMEPYFGALLPLAHRGFTLHITVIVNFWRYFKVDARRLPNMCFQLKRVLKDLEAIGSKVEVTFDFLVAQEEHFPGPWYTLDWAPSTGFSKIYIVGSRSGRTAKGMDFISIKGEEAKKMLGATARQWAKYLIEEVGFDLTVILEDDPNSSMN